MSVLLLALWGRSTAGWRAPRAGCCWPRRCSTAPAGWRCRNGRRCPHTFGGAARLAEGDISSSRFGIWANTLALIRQQPWSGVGFGEFNLAWTLTPFPGRPVAFFDHTHNLPLQLAVELGLPLAAAVMALLLWALVRGLRRAPGRPRATPARRGARRC